MISPDRPLDILVLAPHTDDGELGAGASLARWASEGHQVHYVAFSDCEESLPAGCAPGTLRREVAEATAALGVRADRLRVLDFSVRYFERDRQDVLQAMVELNRELAPDLVLLPSREDLHQDHAVIALEGLRAFKRTSLLGYEVPWNNVSFTTSCFVSVDERAVQAKVAAVQCYASQQHRSYVQEGYLRAQLRFRGNQAGVAHAEAFEVVRWML